MDNSVADHGKTYDVLVWLPTAEKLKRNERKKIPSECCNHLSIMVSDGIRQR